ncbi:uncharacterized protein [Pyxicephalus adspersus]|uniref:uncharacterized protein n=1 Tax=Pyxicephalus adspersus TaxID=30357 RepID=UPI003B5A47BC
MSSCLEKVIEKLTAYKEGMRPAKDNKVEPGSGEDRDLSDACSSTNGTPMHVKREPFLYEGGAVPTIYPSTQIKEEQRPHDSRNLQEMFPPMEYIQYRSVHIKEEPREEGEVPSYCSQLKDESSQREDDRRIMFSAFPMSYLPQHTLFSCGECGKAFTRRTHFLSHQRAHVGEKPFCCSECGKCFSQRSYFVSHQRIHSGEQPFCCFHCGKSFRIKSSLNKHLRTHQAENPFTCPMCHKSFIHRGHFLAHQRLHAEEKKFSCLLCGKSFIHHGHFLAHQRSHTEESRFSCPHCHKSFIHQGHFSAHLRVHTGEKPFTCQDCGCSFSTHHNLVVHQRLHAGSSFTFL